MRKIRVFNKNGKAILNSPSLRYEGKEHACKIPDELEGLPFTIMELSSLPEHDYIEQLYFDSEGELKSDTDWDEILMPECVIKTKKLDDLTASIESDMESLDEDSTLSKIWKFVKFQLLITSPEHSNVDFLEEAQKDLQKSGKSKPVIEAKLQDKINELKAKK